MITDPASCITFILSSSAIIDQVSGPKRRGFGKKRFMQKISAIQNLPPAEQD